MANHAARNVADCVSRIMKVQSILLIALAAASFAFSGCTTETTTTTASNVDQTQKRVHTQEELRKTGQTETGPALEQVDPAVTTSRHP